MRLDQAYWEIVDRAESPGSRPFTEMRALGENWTPKEAMWQAWVALEERICALEEKQKP